MDETGDKHVKSGKSSSGKNMACFHSFMEATPKLLMVMMLVVVVVVVMMIMCHKC
jgi:hypothetical protein